MSDSVMRTVISSGQDALDVLITAIEQDQTPRGVPQMQHTPPSTTYTPGPNASHANSPVVTLFPSNPTTVSENMFRTWSNVRFIRMGWMTALEAITYVDL